MRLRPIVLLCLTLLAAEAAARDRKPPYWASIVPGQARIRTGPGRNYPATWLYQRRGLPVRVVAMHEAWRKVQDPDGTRGWMQANMLTAERSAMVVGGIRTLHARPEAGAMIVWRAEAGVVGRLRRCASGWCELDVGGKRGWIAVAGLWGVAAGEKFEG